MNTSFSDGRGIGRLYVDGEQILTFPPAKRGGGAHNQVQPVPTVPAKACVPAFWTAWRRSLRSLARGKHVVVFGVMVGGPKLRLEFGEGCLAIAKKGGMFRLLGPNPGPELTDEGWVDFVGRTSAELDQRDRKTRQTADLQGDYWRKRHALAQEKLRLLPQAVNPSIN